MKLWVMPLTIRAFVKLVVMAACLNCGSVFSAPITDTVLADGDEWAQINLFTNLSWNDANAVCPGGICGGGTLNGYDMMGWSWANVPQANSLLNYFIGTDLLGLGPDLAEEADSAWGPEIFGAGFVPTETFGSYRGMYAWTSDIATTGCSNCGQNIFVQDLPAGSVSLDRIGSSGSVSFGNSLSTLGALFFRSVDVTPVPAPSTYALLLLGIFGLTFRGSGSK